jgi:5-methylcytosine-specific restriction endonuclease McrA
MKLEILLLLIVGAIIYDTYYGGVVMRYFYLFKKYYKVAGIIFLIFSIYITLKKDPAHIRTMIMQSTGMISKNAGLRHAIGGTTGSHPALNIQSHQPFHDPAPVSIDQPTGGRITKRSVSETKKKFVAYNQEWKCGHCRHMLNAWFEVDHVIRLDQGGSNDASNLVALCRECHGKKTATENM